MLRELHTAISDDALPPLWLKPFLVNQCWWLVMSQSAGRKKFEIVAFQQLLQEIAFILSHFVMKEFVNFNLLMVLPSVHSGSNPCLSVLTFSLKLQGWLIKLRLPYSELLFARKSFHLYLGWRNLPSENWPICHLCKERIVWGSVPLYTLLLIMQHTLVFPLN